MLDSQTYPTAEKKIAKPLSVKIARTMEDMMKVSVIRAAVYMAEQDCPYEEEFDGNDFCATHLIGYVGDEPVACMRLRFFGGFAKMERMAVRPQFRNTRIAFKTIREGIAYCNRKGFSTIYGHARNELIPLWKMFGFEILETSRELVFSEYAYTEMVHESELPENALTLGSDPYQLIRPEGDWDREGVLERSVTRNDGQPAGFAIAAQ
ncbi:GNAT family N-acetyltransferase [Halovulum sp. GXIMD14793]